MSQRVIPCSRQLSHFSLHSSSYIPCFLTYLLRSRLPSPAKCSLNVSALIRQACQPFRRVCFKQLFFFPCKYSQVPLITVSSIFLYVSIILGRWAYHSFTLMCLTLSEIQFSFLKAFGCLSFRGRFHTPRHPTGLRATSTMKQHMSCFKFIVHLFRTEYLCREVQAVPSVTVL